MCMKSIARLRAGFVASKVQRESRSVKGLTVLQQHYSNSRDQDDEVLGCLLYFPAVSCHLA